MNIICLECDNIVTDEEIYNSPVLRHQRLCTQCYLELKYGILHPAKFKMIWGTNIDSSDEAECCNALDNGVRCMEDAHDC